ncbi:hypothetical protein CYMTET_42255 [Cymbomonas tetramitiformis]|uniref:Uncharacterized protein n=1 Tax=Cymbomonas tetramitiformis TaxID=36881 RepID=A0AAE0C4H6_9CHLO|nr:hypothetical protein CYMTET_42255 [Cymbomonas tetramitiformis]
MIVGYLRNEEFGKDVAKEVMKYAGDRELLQCIRTNENIMHTLIEEAIGKVDDLWDIERCHALKVLLGLSDHKYNMLKKLLSSTAADEDSGKWLSTPLFQFDKTAIPMPKLKPLGLLKARREEIANLIDLSENDDGSVAEVDLLCKLREVVVAARNSKVGSLHTRRDRTSDYLEIFIYGDAHGKARGKKVTGVTIRVMPANKEYTNSPFHCYTFLYCERLR